MRFAICASSLLALASGCSMTLNNNRGNPLTRSAPECTRSMTRPVLDLAGATILALIAAGLDENQAGPVLGAAALGGIGFYGVARVSGCRRALASFERGDGLDGLVTSKGGEASSDGDEPAMGPPDPVDAVLADDAPAPMSSVYGRPEKDAPTARPMGTLCRAGARCPRGSVCDPLTARCVSVRQLGIESAPCNGGRCDDGLFCDLESQRCLAGNRGLEGGRCHVATSTQDQCAPGLVCGSGLCVRARQKRAGELE